MLVVESAARSDVENVVRLAGDALRLNLATMPHLVECGCCMVARDITSDQIVGFALATHDAPCEGHLLGMAVDAARRGEGIGNVLLGRLRDALANRGAMRLSLEVRADNERAQAFYQRHGFMPEGLESHAYPDGEDAVHYVRPL